jgi:hypothetical protein
MAQSVPMSYLHRIDAVFALYAISCDWLAGSFIWLRYLLQVV